MNLQSSYQTDIEKLKVLLIQEFFSEAAYVVSDTTSEGQSLPDIQKKKLNSIIVKQSTDAMESMVKRMVRIDSSIDDYSNDVVKEKSIEESSSYTRKVSPLSGRVFEKRLLSVMNEENYTSGEICQSEIFVEETMQQVGIECTMGWLMQIYEKSYGQINILIGILHMLSHFSYDIVKPYGPIMALALLQHKSNAVREFAIKAFENWDSKDSLVFLKNISCDQVFLQQYLDEVIADIEND